MEIKQFVIEINSVTGEERLIDFDGLDINERNELMEKVIEQGMGRMGYHKRDLPTEPIESKG